MTKQELLQLVEALPDDLPAETLERIAAEIRLAQGASEDTETAPSAPASEWLEGAPRQESEDLEPDRWLEERR